MLSPCRSSSAAPLRLAWAAAKRQQAIPTSASVCPKQSSTSASFCTSSSSSSSSPATPSVPSASTSKLPPTFKQSPRHFSSTKSYRAGKAEADQGASDAQTPSYDARLTPRAAEDTRSIQTWLQSAFPGLPLPDEIACMMVTHESWDFGALAGHNRRLSFLGRRAMKFYLSLFLAQHGQGHIAFSNEKIDELLMPWKLGDKVGRTLRLEEVMRWTPAVSDGQKGPRETGLYKIRGVTVEALVGAIYHQHGAQAAKAFFSSRILRSLDGFTEKEAIALESAIDAESRAGDALLSRMAESSISDTAGGRASAGQVEPSQAATPTRESREASNLGAGNASSTASSGLARRRKQASGAKSIPLEDNAHSTHLRDSSALS